MNPTSVPDVGSTLPGYAATPGGLYLSNGRRVAVNTGVKLHVPAGVTVEIRGLRAHRVVGLNVIDEDIVGPQTIDAVDVVIHNSSDATIVIPSGDPIAGLRAIKTVETLSFLTPGAVKPKKGDVLA
jgi:dUTPase